MQDDSITTTEASPPRKNGFPIENLADLLTSLPSLGNDAQLMANDLDTIRKNSTILCRINERPKK